jgi:hypothetical protein
VELHLFNQTKTESDTVTLDATNSTDFDGEIISYNWSQVNGTSVTLENKTSAITTFVSVNATEILEFLLAVVDDSSATDTDSVWITVNPKDDDSDYNEPIEDPQNGDDKNKVEICHIPPGNPDNAHTITVGESAVLAHVAQHGDTIGPCANVSQEDNSEEKSNSGKGNSEEKSNSGKGNSEEKSNSGKAGKGNSEEKSNSGKGNSEEKSNSGKGNSEEKSNSGKGNLEDDDEDKDDEDKED